MRSQSGFFVHSGWFCFFSDFYVPGTARPWDEQPLGAAGVFFACVDDPRFSIAYASHAPQAQPAGDGQKIDRMHKAFRYGRFAAF